MNMLARKKKRGQRYRQQQRNDERRRPQPPFSPLDPSEIGPQYLRFFVVQLAYDFSFVQSQCLLVPSRNSRSLRHGSWLTWTVLKSTLFFQPMPARQPPRTSSRSRDHPPQCVERSDDVLG